MNPDLLSNIENSHGDRKKFSCSIYEKIKAFIPFRHKDGLRHTHISYFTFQLFDWIFSFVTSDLSSDFDEFLSKFLI